MARVLPLSLPPAPPDVVGPEGMPRFGVYSGSFARVDLSAAAGAGLAGRMKRLAREKTWVYSCVATPEVLAACAIIDAGYAASGFAFAADLRQGRFLFDRSFLGAPGLSAKVNRRPAEGAHACFIGPGCRLEIARPPAASSFHLDARAGDFSLRAVLESVNAPPPLAVVAPVPGGTVNCTQKTALLTVGGMLRAGGRTFDLRDGYAGIDFTRGLLGRRTTWRWAFALGRAPDGTPLGFNLAEGFMGGGGENAIWAGRALTPAGEARFDFNRREPAELWRIRTADGALDLTFTPRAVHQDNRNLLLVRSRFVQVAGLFAGTVRTPDGRTHQVEALPGVTEDQDTVW